MAERSNAAVLKTVDCHRSGGSNPSLSAKTQFKRSMKPANALFAGFFIFKIAQNVHLKSILIGVIRASGGCQKMTHEFGYK